jgi:hypothetical protein
VNQVDSGTLKASPNSVSFGAVSVGQTASTAVSLVNGGSAPVEITQLNLTGLPFSVVAPSDLPVTIAAGGTYSLNVQFDPAATGTVTGQLTVASNASTNGTAVIALTGTGMAAPPALSALSCSSGAMTGSGTDACTVTLSTSAPSGGLNVNLSSSSSAVTVPNTVTVPAGATSAGFTAAASSVATAQAVTMTASAGSIFTSFTLQLNAAILALSINATSVAFGDVAVNTPATQSVTMTSTGTVPVMITGATLTGAGFTVSGVGFPATLNPNQEATLNIEFDPTVLGPATGQLTVASNSLSSDASVIALNGTGTSGAREAVSVTPSSLSFGSGAIGSKSAAQTVTLTNMSGLPLSISDIGLEGTDAASFSVSNDCGTTLAAGGNCPIELSFLPTVPGVSTASLTIADSAADSPQTVPLSGTGSNTSSPYWLAPSVESVNALGTVMIPIISKGPVQLLSPTIIGNGGPLVCMETSWSTDGTSLTITYKMGTETVHVVVQVTPTSAGIKAQIDADQQVITSVDMGNWASTLNADAIAVPYYTGSVWYSKSLSAYVNGWWDWHSTQATHLNDTGAQYLAKTDGTLNKLHDLMELAVSANVDAVFPDPGNAASPYMATLSGRTILDIWDAGFSEIQSGLSDLGDYGITNCVGIIHDWQYAGYDNALPEHYPANAELGGGAGLSAAIAQGQFDGCLMAVHENYVDYYPNYPNFNSAAVALNSDGSQMLSWLNLSTGIQSFAAKPTWMQANADTQSPMIHSLYGTTAGFLDVNSSVSPSWHGDMDASSPQAGMLAAFVQNSQALWAYERQVHNGPVLGEGDSHWYYSGLLDGVEAQLGAGGIPVNTDTSLPLFVDFDLLQIHPLQVNHGMGYYDRWTQSGAWSMTTAQMDGYRMQEIAFGHAPFLTVGTWNNVPLAFVESNLVSPVAASYGTALANSIQYQVNGAWTSSSAAALSGQFTQVQVAYNNGLTLVANASTTPLTWNSLTIPQYGWAAKNGNLLAYTAQCGSTICDYAQTPTSIFANSRNQSDAEIGWGYAAPSVAEVKQGSGSSFTITFDWLVYRSLGTQVNYTAFVHFVNDLQASDANGGIVFQGDHQPSPPTSMWQVGQTVSDGPITVAVPSSVPDGTYSIRMGLYDPATGEPLLLSGNNDGTERYIVGYLTVSGGGTQVHFSAPSPPANNPRLNATGTLVNFGTVQTDGMISITKEDGQWVLRPFPRYRNFSVLLNKTNFPMPTVVQAAGTSASAVVPVDQGAYWQLPLNGDKTYSWPVN